MFIVLEGSDGSGKTTQFNLLVERLRAAGHDVDTYDFPRYDQPSSHFVKQYLNGEYGPAAEVSPYTASLFYALDRFEAAPLIRQSIADGKIVLANRYAGSNMAHQGAKFTNAAQQRGFFVWADSLEFQLLGIPRPDINVFLSVPADTAFELIKQKNKRSYTDRSHDEHESDIEHLRKAVSTYDSLCRLFPKDYKAVECAVDGKILEVTEINNRLWKLIKPLLPKPNRPGHSTIVKLGESKLQEKTGKSPGAEAITDGQSIEVKDISLLSLSALELFDGIDVKYSFDWPPKDRKARLAYYIPPQFPAKLAKTYQEVLNKQAENRRSIGATSTSLEGLVPMALLVDAEISYNPDTIRRFSEQESSSASLEMHQLVDQIGGRRAAAKEKDNSQEEPAALRQIIKQLSDKGALQSAAGFDEKIKLLEFWPRNELDLLADCLYPHSSLSRGEIGTELSRWTYDEKADALKKICRQNPQIVLSNVRYRFDVIADLPEIRRLKRQLNPKDLLLQPLTVRFGYEVPKEIEIASADEPFINNFDLSLKLFSEIQAAGYDDLAAYGVLAGHRQRCQFSVDGVLLSALNGSMSPDSLSQLRQKVAEVHPLISRYAAVTPKKAPPVKNQPNQSRRTPRRAGRGRRAKH